MERVPIIITIKSFSERCKNKNFELLPYTLDYLKRLGRIEDVIIISDSDKFEIIANEYHSIKEYFIEERETWWCEFNSLANYLSKTPQIKRFIWLNVTQPCRSLDLIENAIAEDLSAFDLVTSYCIVPNRDIFKINNDMTFKYEGSERKGSLCEAEMIADGALYYMSSEFLFKVVKSESPNKMFWNSRVKFIENKAPLVDIDTESELDVFKTFYK